MRKTTLNLLKVAFVIVVSQFILNETVGLVSAIILFYVLMNNKND